MAIRIIVQQSSPPEPAGPIYGPETFDTTISGLYGSTVRVVIPASDLTKSASVIDLEIAGLGWSSSMDGLKIGNQGASEPIFDGSEVTIGNVSPWNAGGNTFSSVSFALDHTKNLILEFSLPAEDEIPSKVGSSGHNVYVYTGGDPNNPSNWSSQSVQHSLVAQIDKVS